MFYIKPGWRLIAAASVCSVASPPYSAHTRLSHRWEGKLAVADIDAPLLPAVSRSARRSNAAIFRRMNQKLIRPLSALKVRVLFMRGHCFLLIVLWVFRCSQKKVKKLLR